MPTFLLKLLRYLFFERAANRTPLADYPARLEATGRKIQARIDSARDSPQNRSQLAHVIGIERWGQSRLRVALGHELTLDDYDGYRPPADRSWAELQQDFAMTRQGTIAIARRLIDARIPVETAIPHNQFGPMTIRTWLQYLSGHAQFESRGIK